MPRRVVRVLPFWILGLSEALVKNVRPGSGSANAGGARLVQPMSFTHKLRICNAYPFQAALEVFRGGAERLTVNGSLPYKACHDYIPQLKKGDKLEFKVGDSSAGNFTVSDLPNNDATLLLVIHRHDTLSTSVSFESHVFSNLQSAQVAVIDAYKGRAKVTTRIMDAAGQRSNARNEEIGFDSVVAVDPGVYEVELDGQNGTLGKSQLVAKSHESYVVLRMGIEAQTGQSYPQELVVFPRSAAIASTPGLLVMLLVAAFFAS